MEPGRPEVSVIALDVLEQAVEASGGETAPSQTNGLLKLGFLDGIPILWTVVVFIVIIGSLYYLLVGRKKAFAPVIAPAGDDAPLAGTGAAPPA